MMLRLEVSPNRWLVNMSMTDGLSRPGSRWEWIVQVMWASLSALAVVMVPGLLYHGVSLSALAADQRTQSWMCGVATALLFVALKSAAPWPRGWRYIRAPLIGGVIFGAAHALLLFVMRAPTPVVVTGASLALAVALVAASAVLGRWLAAVSMPMAALVLLLFVRDRPTPQPLDAVLETTLHRVRVIEHGGLIDSMGIAGGGMAPLGRDFLLVTGSGRFYRVGLAPDHSPTVRRLALTGEFNAAVRRQQLRELAPVGSGFPMRAGDVAVDTSAQPNQVYLSHAWWNSTEKCYTARVSRAPLPPDTATQDGPTLWEKVFETWPCVHPSFEMARTSASTRLAWAGPGQLMFTVGSHSLGDDSGTSGAQTADNAYGKVFRLAVDGTHELFTRGHRNPQGLVVRRNGEVWSTEHGPQGGDEVNLLQTQQNYGWPLFTYGVQYGEDRWPLAGDRRDHTGFTEPMLAFVPSIGISNLIELGAHGFPSWEGDLLVSSLRAGTLFRLRTRQGRIVYSEPMVIGTRIRDLEQAPDGRIILWTDPGTFVVLVPAPAPLESERAMQSCKGCHGASLEGTPAAPSLTGIVGREVASVPGFAYSPALRALGGRWTLERLNAYIRDPQSVAPGTVMPLSGVSDSMRVFVVYYLRDHQTRP